jgi:hypothetical protein
MNIKDVLLTPKEKTDICTNGLTEDCTSEFSCNTCPKLDKAQCLKLLDVLRQKDMIWHYQGIRNSKPFCYDDCKLCEIEKLLKGGE